MSGSSLALHNLRAVIILVVVAFHSVLAYLGSLPASAPPFDAPSFAWREFPIVDSHRWFAFDLFCALQDVYLMSLMFFLSGLFIWPSLVRKGPRAFSIDRLLRLGLPYAWAVLLLMPLAHYPVYLQTAADPSLSAYWRHWLALPFWPSGPPWFLMSLLVFNILAGVLRWLAPAYGERIAAFASIAGAHPVRFFFGLVVVSALAYVPMAIAFTPWEWIQFGAFSFQLSRPLHNAVYFFAGVGVGAYGIERGLLDANGILARHWGSWLAAAAGGFLLWMGPTALIMEWTGQPGPLALQAMADIGFAVSCASACFCVLAISMRFARNSSRPLASLADNAYGIYLIHYVFTVWLQYELLGAGLFAGAKAAIVFTGALSASWGIVVLMRQSKLGGWLLGAEQPKAPRHMRVAAPASLALGARDGGAPTNLGY